VAKHRHKRERSGRDLERRQGKRPAYDRILIVTEGSKTEPNYLNEIRIERRVPSAHIRVVPSEGTQPLKVVEHAEMLFRNLKEYERVFAVFDRDSHPLDNYQNALMKAETLNGKLKNSEGKRVTFAAVPSVPCFEFWFLLHFENVQAFHDRQVIYKKLLKHWPKYKKGDTGTYAASAAKIPEATKRAVNLRRQYSARNGSEPFTDVDILVAILQAKAQSRS
jgi:hypothetical protein